MIGYTITGRDTQGHKCQGIILDKIITPQTVEMGQGSQALGGNRQVLPMPLSSYLVQDIDGRIHIVTPMAIESVDTGTGPKQVAKTEIFTLTRNGNGK